MTREEITQEVFLALFRHLQLENLGKNLRGWIFRVAHNLALKQRYANQRSHDTKASDWTIAERQFDPSPNPEEQVSFSQRRRRLLAVLQGLPGRGPVLPSAACRGSPIPGNCGFARNLSGRRIDVADAITCTSDACRLGVKAMPSENLHLSDKSCSSGGRRTASPSRRSSPRPSGRLLELPRPDGGNRGSDCRFRASSPPELSIPSCRPSTARVHS